MWITFSKYFSYFLHTCSLMISVKLGYLCGSGFNVKASVCCGSLEHGRRGLFPHKNTFVVVDNLNNLLARMSVYLATDDLKHYG